MSSYLKIKERLNLWHLWMQQGILSRETFKKEKTFAHCFLFVRVLIEKFKINEILDQLIGVNLVSIYSMFFMYFIQF